MVSGKVASAHVGGTRPATGQRPRGGTRPAAGQRPRGRHASEIRTAPTWAARPRSGRADVGRRTRTGAHVPGCPRRGRPGTRDGPERPRRAPKARGRGRAAPELLARSGARRRALRSASSGAECEEGDSNPHGVTR